jgi:hypothetical protein
MEFVVVGGEVATLLDAITWQQAGAGVVSAFSVAWNGQTFLACGMANCYTSSTVTRGWAAYTCQGLTLP